jgi:two-component system OmpR family response regulator
VKGLRSGGDDYLAKPYAFSELLARVESLGRRRQSQATAGPETALRYEDLSLDLLSRGSSGAAASSTSSRASSSCWRC